MHDQPNVTSDEHAGYLFDPASHALLRDKILSKPLAQWAPGQTREVQAVFPEPERMPSSPTLSMRGTSLLRQSNMLIHYLD